MGKAKTPRDTAPQSDTISFPLTIDLTQIKAPDKTIAAIQNKLNGHRHENTDSPYRENDIAKMLVDPMVDKTTWPKFGAPLIMSPTAAPQTLSAKYDYYLHLFQNLMAKYTAMLIKNDEEHFQTYDTVVKSTPMCDINPLFTDYKISRFSTLRSPASEQGVEAMRKYDWQLFIPPTNKFTVITGPQRYTYIELLNLNAHDRKMTFRVSDFAGQRIRWSMRSWAEYELSFQPKTPNRTLPMNIKYLGASSYEHILSHTKEAKFSKEETAFWYALFGLEEMTDPAIIVVKLPPHDNHPDGAKLGITVCNAKSDIAIIQKIQGITIVNVDRSLGQDAFKENVMKDEIVRYLQLIAMINSELIDNTADIRKAGQTGTTITSPGGFIFSFPSPTQIRGGTA